MANEITVTTLRKTTLSAVFLFPLTGQEGVPVTPASDLPEGVEVTLTTAQVDALNDGSAVFKVVQMGIAENVTGVEMKARMQAYYAAMEPEIQTKRDNTYKFFGTKVDKA